MQSTWDVTDMIASLQSDPWRDDNPFSPDVVKCHADLFNGRLSRIQKAKALSDWLADFQPCLFGRMEARQERLAFCVLTENDLERSDQYIREYIETSRAEWRRGGLSAHSHGFVIVAISPAIALARPNSVLHRLAMKLCD